ncbi:hypothetical protein CPB85DRAFT_325702 [Mucidula mucida]|nr:hypothetical protein CPB85DRAFT_325702 [Mucidula mucida]
MAGPPSSIPSEATLTNVTPQPQYSPVFLSTRSIAFALISFISLLCIVILCVQIFLEWDIMPKFERSLHFAPLLHPHPTSSPDSLVVVMLMIHATTIIMLPVLIIVQFRPWLDALRLSLLLVLHLGTGALFTHWFRRFQSSCPKLKEQCILFNIYVLSGSWIVSTLLIVYAAGLALLVYRRARMPADSSDEASTSTVVKHGSILPVMAPPLPSPLPLTSPLPIASRYAQDRRFSDPRSQRSAQFRNAPSRISILPTTPAFGKRMTATMSVPYPSLPSPSRHSQHVSMISPSERRLTMQSVRYYGVAV